MYLTFFSTFIFNRVHLNSADIPFISTIMEIILWDFLMFYQIFLSPQVKRSAININNHCFIFHMPSCLKCLMVYLFPCLTRLYQLLCPSCPKFFRCRMLNIYSFISCLVTCVPLVFFVFQLFELFFRLGSSAISTICNFY